MDLDVLSKLAELSCLGWLDPSNGYVTVSFFNNLKDDKADMVAFLNQDMSWDLREVLGETSTVNETSEVVVINHTLVGVFEMNSEFDVLLRKMLKANVDGMREDDMFIPVAVVSMEKVLRDNRYSERD